MAIVVNKKEQKDFEIPADGLYQAVLADVIDLGDQPTNYGTKHRVRFIFILSDTDSDGRPFRLMQQMSLSLHEKSIMFKAVRRLLGKDPGESLDLETLIGKQCQLDVIQNEGAEGKIFANIATILAPIKNQAVGIPADFVRDCNKEKDQKPAQKAAPKTAPKTAPKNASVGTSAPKTTPAPTSTTRSAAKAGVEVGPQEGSVEISDDDIPF